MKNNNKNIDDFLDDLTMNKGRGEKTKRAYMSDLKLFCSVVNKSIIDCSKDDLLKYKYHLISNKLAPATINRKFSVIQSFYEYLLKKKQIKNNPTQEIEKLKLPKKIPITLNHSQASLLLDGIQVKGRYSKRDYAIFCTFLFAGCRVSEIVNLNVGDVDLDSDLIVIRNAKGSKDRAIPIIKPLKDALISYLETKTVYEMKNVKLKTKVKRYSVIAKHKCGRDYFIIDSKEEALFLTKYGKRFSSKGIEYHFKEYTKTLGILKKGLSLHALRRSCLTYLFNEGADIFTLKEISGHSRVQTLEHYLAIDMNKMRTVMNLHPLTNRGISSRLVDLVRDEQ